MVASPPTELHWTDPQVRRLSANQTPFGGSMIEFGMEVGDTL